MRVATLYIASVACLVSGVGLAQKPTELVVEAPHVAKTTQPGPHGTKLSAMSIDYTVTFADLNLATHSGVVELQKRIKDSATNACQPKNRVPKSPGMQPCTELETRGGIWRYDANKTDQRFSPAERFATGIRNAEGLAIDRTGRRPDRHAQIAHRSAVIL